MIVKSAATYCDSGSMGFRIFGADVDGVAWVGHFFALRYLDVRDPVEDVYAFSGAFSPDVNQRSQTMG